MDKRIFSDVMEKGGHSPSPAPSLQEAHCTVAVTQPDLVGIVIYDAANE
jgi:hypothetical protein